MENKLADKKVAILIADGFEQSEFEQPLEALKEEGATVDIISLKKGTVKAWKNKNWGDEFEATMGIEEVNSGNYDALVLPGGVMSPDKLRMNDDVISFVKGFMKAEKPIAAICHGPWTLIETAMLKGRVMTSYPSLKKDLINAGAEWVDEEVVVDENIITSRNPADLPAFCRKMVDVLSGKVYH